MQTVQGMGVEEGVQQSGTTDVGDNRYLISGELQLLEALIKRLNNKVMRTAGTEDGRSVWVEKTGHEVITR